MTALFVLSVVMFFAGAVLAIPAALAVAFVGPARCRPGVFKAVGWGTVCVVLGFCLMIVSLEVI